MDGNTHLVSPTDLYARLGTASAPLVIDVRRNDAFNTDETMIIGALRRPPEDVEHWKKELQQDRPVVAYCVHGHEVSQGVTASLHGAGINTNYLEGGITRWKESGLPTRRKRDASENKWVTREHPKIDRIACPWLIRRFIDPNAVFLFVAPAEVVAVGERFNAVPFDIENVFWSHRGELCTFDVMVEEFGLATPPLLRLATMVRAADTARLDLCPEAPGLLAASLGLSRMYDNDLEQLEAGIALYDAFYRWCRDATGETHNWPTNKAKS